jgi:hypothetical protein
MTRPTACRRRRRYWLSCLLLDDVVATAGEFSPLHQHIDHRSKFSHLNRELNLGTHRVAPSAKIPRDRVANRVNEPAAHKGAGKGSGELLRRLRVVKL